MSTGGENDMLDVRVTQDTSKRLQFADTSFGPPGIQVHLEEELGNCELNPRFNSDIPGFPTKSDLLEELNFADIQAGYLIVRIDKKKKTAEFFIEYFVTDPELEGRIRIFFRQDLDHTGNFGEVTFVTEDDLNFPGTDLTLTGSIAIDWADAPGPDLNLNESRVLVCDGEIDHHGNGVDDHEVTVELVPVP